MSLQCRVNAGILTAAVLALAPAAVGRPTTTAPGARTYIRVVITKGNVAISDGASAARGAWIIFHVFNRSTTSAKVSFLGRLSAPIAPNHRGSLAVFAVRRGAFPIVMSLSGDRLVRRTFVVY